MKRRFSKIDALLCILVVTCVTLALALCAAQPLYLIPVAAVIILVSGIVLFFIRSMRRTLARLLHGIGYADSDAQQSLAALTLPVLVLSGEHILWYNEAFRTGVLTEQDKCLLPVQSVFPAFNKAQASESQGLNLEHEGQRYSVYGGGMQGTEGVFVAYFVNNTLLKRQSGEYLAARPSVMLIAVDTYDEILKEMKESDRARILGAIDVALEQFIGTTTGLLRRISASRYLAVVEERHMQEIVRSRFAVLDTVRNIATDSIAVTLSIGVGRLGDTLRECEDMAEQALDMALGRGGDQAAVKSKESFEFYGGVSRGVEKRNKVRSRIIATALCDLIRQSERVIITGHKASDLDSIGAAAGVWRICRICERPAAIMTDERQTLAGNLISELRAEGVDFMRPENAENVVNDRTLLVIVDTHMSQLLENPQVYHAAKNVVVIDHHRRCVGYIEDAVVFYHEPAASSASELVTELLQYTESEKDSRLTPEEAQALLAGIMLDTRNFALHTGVRTFEAAAYLRRMGAQTTAVKKLFNSSFEGYAYRAQLVTDAELFMGCAVVAEDHLPPELSVVVPQAANDLLTIDGVDASFVAVDMGGQINISARSMGEVNVQLVMETLGGGGHMAMAGVQMKDTTLAEAKHLLLDAIADYRACNSKK
ncbi:MAG: DHH family phosphoesterase [Ruthenibacterium sp.]